MSEFKPIDIKTIFRERNPGIAKMIPGFLYRYLRHILHQKEINQALENYHHLEGAEFVDKSLDLLEFRYTVIGKENIPRRGRYIFIANHPLGGLDGLILIKEISNYYPGVKFIVNDLLMNLPNLVPVFLPVNKHGRQSIDYYKKIENAYLSDIQIATFPAGLCSRKQKGIITDLEWKKSFLDKAIKYQRNIIPVYVKGKNSNFFYNLSNFRKFFGIKANLEMFYLPNEMFKQREKDLSISFGKPIPYTFFDNKHKKQEWVQLLKKHVYDLKNDHTKTFIA
jgi:putative hemolysin